MSSDIFKCLISEEEMLALSLRQARYDGRKLPLSQWSEEISQFYRTNVCREDDSFEFRDLGDGKGLHLFRPCNITDEEMEFLRARRHKASLALERQKAKRKK
jgi:hypothetical protein